MTVIELLAKQAAEQRELSRARGVAANDAKPAVEQAAAAMTDSRKQIEALEGQLAELHRAIADTEQAIADAQGTHQQTADRHAEALAVVAEHDREAQAAADTADKLDRLAAQMREARPEPPHEALQRTGLMTEPPKVVEPGFRTPDGVALVASALTPEAHTCAEMGCTSCLGCDECTCHDPAHSCLPWDESTRAECTGCQGAPPADSPFDVRPADPGTVARVAGALPVTPPPFTDEPVATHGPTTTMPDLGPARPPLDPPPGEGTHSHARPGALSRLTGGWPVVGRKKNDEQDGDDR